MTFAIPETTWTPETLRARLGASTGTTPEDATRLLEEASVIVADIFAKAFRDVPQTIVDICVFRCARGLRDGWKASTGGGQIGVTDALPLRAPADPLASSYPIIRRYVVIGL